MILKSLSAVLSISGGDYLQSHQQQEGASPFPVLHPAGTATHPFLSFHGDRSNLHRLVDSSRLGWTAHGSHREQRAGDSLHTLSILCLALLFITCHNPAQHPGIGGASSCFSVGPPCPPSRAPLWSHPELQLHQEKAIHTHPDGTSSQTGPSNPQPKQPQGLSPCSPTLK